MNLQAPLPAPRPYSLLDVATLASPTNNRWLGGGWIGGDVPGPAHTHDPCSTGSDRIKATPGDIATPEVVGTFNVYLTGMCTAQSIGPDPRYWTDRLKLAFQVYESAAVERVLVTGDGHGALGPFLGDNDVEILGSGVVDPAEGLALLEDEIARNGSGIIHATPGTIVAWTALSLLDNSRGNLTTVGSGTKVVNGAGYIDAYPSGESAPAADQAWAWASGPIEIYRGDTIQLVAADYAASLDRSNNDALFIAERPYLLNWLGRADGNDDNHTQAAVLIDRVAGT